MPVQRQPTENVIDMLVRRVNNLQSDINELKNNAYPTVPVYDYNSLPSDPIEGQIAIIANAPDFVYPGGLVLKRQHFGIGATTAVPAGGGGATNLNWGSSAGPDTLVSMSGTDIGVLLEDGLIFINVSVIGYALTNNKTFSGNVQLGSFAPQYFGGTGGGDVTAGRSLIGKGFATSGVQIQIYNNDTASRDFQLYGLTILQVNL